MTGKTIAKRNPGRPSKYGPELAEKICLSLVMGMSLVEILKKKGMPHYSNVMRWLQTKEEFRDMYARAREMQADFLAESVIDIADEPVTSHDDVARNRLRCDVRKWYAAKLAPRKYGDKVEHEMGGVDGESIPIIVNFVSPPPRPAE